MSRPQTSEGAGNAGRSMRPQPRVQIKKAHEHSHHGHTGFTRHSPRNGFNGLYRALPGDRAFLSPSSALRLANLTPASGRQDHTTSPSASRRPRLWRRPRPPHPAPTFVTMANAPLWDRTARNIEVIWVSGKQKYFCKRDWTGQQIRLIRSNKLPGARRGELAQSIGARRGAMAGSGD